MKGEVRILNKYRLLKLGVRVAIAIKSYLFSICLLNERVLRSAGAYLSKASAPRCKYLRARLKSSSLPCPKVYR